MLSLKLICRESIPHGLERADRYRLLNEPEQAESICLDILRVEPDNQQALVTLLLALADQFGAGDPDAIRQANEVLPRLKGEYERRYYAGVICERRAHAEIQRSGLGSLQIAHDYFRQALAHYEQAEACRPAGNDDALLRWNTCVRTMQAETRAGGWADVT